LCFFGALDRLNASDVGQSAIQFAQPMARAAAWTGIASVTSSARGRAPFARSEILGGSILAIN
jgi:hypothetical protein